MNEEEVLESQFNTLLTNLEIRLTMNWLRVNSLKNNYSGNNQFQKNYNLDHKQSSQYYFNSTWYDVNDIYRDENIENEKELVIHNRFRN